MKCQRCGISDEQRLVHLVGKVPVCYACVKLIVDEWDIRRREVGELMEAQS